MHISDPPDFAKAYAVAKSMAHRSPGHLRFFYKLMLTDWQIQHARRSSLERRWESRVLPLDDIPTNLIAFFTRKFIG